MNQNNFFMWLPEEVTSQIFSQLDIQSLCNASMTCKTWNDTIRNNDLLWKPHCLALQAVCKREVDDDQKNGYSWKDTLLRNYKKSQVKHSWLSGRFSNIDLSTLLSETTMCPMDAETWGEILEAELNRSEIKNDGVLPGTLRLVSCQFSVLQDRGLLISMQQQLKKEAEEGTRLPLVRTGLISLGLVPAQSQGQPSKQPDPGDQSYIGDIFASVAFYYARGRGYQHGVS